MSDTIFNTMINGEYMIAAVALGHSTRKYDREYHYIVPDSMKDMIVPGIRVIVPFGRTDRPAEAYVLKVFENSDTEGLKVGLKEGLKEIKRAVDTCPAFKEDMLRLSGWMKNRYICTYSDVLRCMLPPGIGVKAVRVVRLEKHRSDIDMYESRVIGDENGIDADCRKVIEALSAGSNECISNECIYEELRERVNVRNFSKTLKQLEEKGFVSIRENYTTGVGEKTIRVAFLVRTREEVVEEIESNRINRIQQIKILEMLLDNEFISVSDIVRFSSVSPGVLNTLKKYGYIDFKDITVNRDPGKNRPVEKTQPLEPTPQQAEVLRKAKELLDMGEFAEALLHGVTGSGKTEVYLQLIRYCMEKGKQAIVLVPEISLTPQMVERFRGRFGDRVGVQHSRLSLGERYDQWRLIRDGRIEIAVGARSAVFAPFDRLGMVIIDEEHESTYKSEITPKYHARDVAQERCRLNNALLLYGSATPSVETYHKAAGNAIGLLVMCERANKMLMPKVEIVDMRMELDAGNRSIFSRRLRDEIGDNIRSAQQTMLFLNRRGYSSFVLCRKCGYTLKCINCNISLTYHASGERLICHYCGYTIKNPDLCPKCKSNCIKHFGTGTQKVEEEIERQFPGCSTIRMDMDTTTFKNSHEEILRAFREQNINVMVGTQMIAKGHDFPNVTLVGVLAADSLLNSGDFKASERTFQLVTQVSGRAGRGAIPGRVVIQTYNTEDFSILAACSHDYSSFYNQEIQIREKLDYPPFTNIASVILTGTNDQHALSRAKTVREMLSDTFRKAAGDVDFKILGPARPPLSRIKTKYRWRILVKCKSMDILTDSLGIVSDGFYAGRDRNSTVDLNVDINPVNML